MEIISTMLRRGRTLAAVFIVAVMATAGIAQADTVSDNAADWLITQQFDSASTTPGAFPWKPGGPATVNTQGATALGLLRVYERSGNADALAAAVANGNCQLLGDTCISGLDYPDGHHHFATHDPLFLVQLSIDSGDSQYAQFVYDQLWSRLTSVKYGASQDWDAADFADAVLTGRTSQGYPELVAFDLSKMVIAADLAGETATRDAMMERILTSLNESDAGHTTYDIIGLAGAVWASAETGIDLDPTTGKWEAAGNTAELAAMLLDYQAPGGGFISDSSNLPPTDANTETQTTSYAMQALASVNSTLYNSQINDGFTSIADAQLTSGQYLAWPNADPNADGSVEVHGETMEAYADIVLGADRWVSTAGGSDTGDCSDQNNRCATISYAIDQASNGNTIHIAAGTYTNALTITKDGLKLVGEDPLNKPVLTRFGGGINQPLLVIDGAKNVSVENLEFGMDQSFVAEGILAGGFVDGLTIRNNHFVSSRTSAGINSGYGFRNAISINNPRNSRGLSRVDGSAVLIDGNVIDGVGDAGNGIFMRAGVNMDAGVGVISNNTITTINHDINVRFAAVTGSSTSSDLSITNNHMFGRGLEFNAPNGTVHQISITGNELHAPAFINGTDPYAADFSLVRLINNAQAVPTTVSGNSFIGYQGNFRGVLIENYPGIDLTDNTFTPAQGPNDFVSLVVSNKEITTDSPALAPLNMSLTAKGNTFNGSGVAGVGTAVEFLNDNDASETAAFGILLFGGTGSSEVNNFDGNLQWYFHLDNHTCDTVTTPCTFLDYDGAIGSNAGTNTEVRPFTGDVNAANNLFDGVAPSAMTPAEQDALEARTYDSNDNAALGTVDYGLTAATITLDAGTLSATYDGNPHAVTATTSPSDLNYEVTYDGSTTVPTDVGSYAVVATITEPGYTADPASGTLTISKATGTVEWDQLSFTYNGSTQTVTARIAEEPATSCTVTPAAVGPDAGSYAVSASCTGNNYDASGSDTAVINPAPATLTLSNLTQAYDGSPKPVTVTSTPSGVSYSVTYDGNSAAPSAVGDYAVVATITDPNYTGAQASGVLRITEAPNTDLAVSITDYRDYAQYGHVLTYGIVVSNVGNQGVTGASVNDVLPDTLQPVQPVSWHCYPGADASCTPISGSGDLSTSVDIPQGGSVTIILDTIVNDDQSLTTDLIQNSVTVSASGDSNAANDSATDMTQAVIFRDGFELNSDGAQVPMSVIGAGDALSLDASNSQMLDLRGAWASTDSMVEIARLRSGNGDRLRVQALHVGEQLLVRMSGQVDGKPQVSAWTIVQHGTGQLAIGMAASGEQRTLLLVGGAQDLQMQLSDDPATLQVWSPSTTDK